MGCLEFHFTALTGVPINLTNRRGMVEQRKPSATVLPGGDAATARLCKAVRRFRRLRELVKAWPLGVGRRPHRADCLVQALSRAEAPSSDWAGKFDDLSIEKLPALLAQAQAECTEVAVHARESRRDRWHGWCNDPKQVSKVFRYVRDGPAPCRSPEVQVLNPGPAGPQQVLHEVDDWWWKLWQPSTQALCTDRWFETFDGFPAFPEVEPLAVQTLASVLRAAPSAKAAGRDGWTYADLKRLPRTALVLLCDIFQSTERTGKWPEPIAHSFVAMLPKGGTGAPDDYRPVVLLSVFYRLWARCRGREFQAYLRSAGVVPPGKSKSAESLAFDLALRIAVAQSGDAAVSGLALDWSKCYDHLLLSSWTGS